MRPAVASIAVVAVVLLVGALADFDDARDRTAFALGVVAATFGYLVGDVVLEAARRG